MKKTMLTGMLLLGMVVNVSASEIMDQAVQQFKPIPYGIPEISGNPVTNEKITLGKALFFDPRLSKSGLISCNTCHNVGMGGDDFQETSTGHGWQQGPRNSPTVLNAVFNLAQFWDGRAKDLKDQAKGPVQASVEMNNTPQGAMKTINSMPEYIEMFKKAFPDDKNPVTFDNMAAAIEIFETTLTTPDARFDKFLRGQQSALSASEQRGLGYFMEKGCVECHGGVNMGGEDYFPFGVVERPVTAIMGHDKGRFTVTQSDDDEYVFKSPSLRNIALTAPYFHSGKVWSLKEAVEVMGSAQLGISLSKQEIDDINTFLNSTTGVQPEVVYPILPATTDSTPQPVLK